MLKHFIEHRWFQNTIIALIVVNAAILGAMTYPDAMAKHGTWLLALDHAILWVFAAELGLRLWVYRARFFRESWNLFDLVVVAIAFLPANESFAVLRALRVLRVLRLISAFPKLRRVITGLMAAIPGIGSIAAILVIIFYVFAVMATKLFAADYPDWFGSLHGSLFTLFQIMTLEGWADIVREVMKTHPHAWVFFMIYILASTFTVLNLFIAVIVDAMQRQHQEEETAEAEDIASIKRDIAAIRAQLEGRKEQ
jgi:voltage-gated sodium channel